MTTVRGLLYVICVHWMAMDFLTVELCRVTMKSKAVGNSSFQGPTSSLENFWVPQIGNVENHLHSIPDGLQLSGLHSELAGHEPAAY